MNVASKGAVSEQPPASAGGGQPKLMGMNPHTRRWLERAQVEVAAVVAFAAAWFVVWPVVRPTDPNAALTFLPQGNWGGLIVFAAAVWVLAALAAAMTPTARTEGALMAALAGVAGLALRSGTMATLLQQSESHLRTTFAALACETAILAAVLGGAVTVVYAVRAGTRRLLPRWSWPASIDAPPHKPTPGAKRRWPAAGNLAGCIIVHLAIAIVALVLTFRSSETGQIAFALVASCLVGALAAHQFFPVRSSVPFWIGPLVLGVAILALGGHVAEGKGPEWYQAIMVSQSHKLPLRAALPVHWLSLGCGGTMAGMWISQRMRDPDRHDRARGALLADHRET